MMSFVPGSMHRRVADVRRPPEWRAHAMPLLHGIGGHIWLQTPEPPSPTEIPPIPPTPRIEPPEPQSPPMEPPMPDMPPIGDPPRGPEQPSAAS